MKIPKQILFSLLVLPFMLKTCEIGPETHGCNLPGEYRIKLTKAVGKYTQLENQRKSLEAQIKASHNRTVMKKLQQELVQVEAEIQSLNLHIALPGHKPVPTKTMTPIQQLEGEIAKAQENNLTAVQSVCNTMDSYQNNNGPAVEYQFGSTGSPGTRPGGSRNRLPFDQCLNKLYFNLAGHHGGMGSVRSALTGISPKRLVFGTDYPQEFRGDTYKIKTFIENIRGLDMEEEDRSAMLGENARELLGL